MDSHVLRLRSQAGQSRPRLRPLAVYKPSFSLNNNEYSTDEGGQALLESPTVPSHPETRCLQPQPPPVPAHRRREVAPSGAWASKHQDATTGSPCDGDRDGPDGCCCGAVAVPAFAAMPAMPALPWARTSDKHIGKAMNTRGIFSSMLSGDPGEQPIKPVTPPPLQQQRQQLQSASLGPGPTARSAAQPTGRPTAAGVPVCRGPPLGQPEGQSVGRPAGPEGPADAAGPVAAQAAGQPAPPWSAPSAPTAPAAPSYGVEAFAAPGLGSPLGGDPFTANADWPSSAWPLHCCSEDSVANEGEDGLRKMLEAPRRKELPPLPPLSSTPLRRRVLTLLPPATAATIPASVGPMDRLNKFRFGSRVDDRRRPDVQPAERETPQDTQHVDRARPSARAPRVPRTPRTSDKTERLRELTERLKGGPGPDPAGPPPSSPSLSPSPTPGTAGKASAPLPPAEATATTAACSVDGPVDDLFDLRRPESRTIVGSYIQRTIPFRSASFSQVDFSDGKYCRHSPRATWLKPLAALGAATLPRHKTAPSVPSPVAESHAEVAKPAQTYPQELGGIAAGHISPVTTSSSTVEPTESSVEPSGSTPSVDSAVESAIDSAVGSDEGCFEPTRSPPRVSTRSMTHPLPTRAGPLAGPMHDFISLTLSATLDNSSSSLDQSDVEVAMPSPDLSPPLIPDNIKPLENPVSYEVFVRQFPNYKEYEKWMNESVLANDGDQNCSVEREWQNNNIDSMGSSNNNVARDASASDGDQQGDLSGVSPPAPLEHDDRCINNFDPSTCPKCLDQMETGPSILQKLKASFHMEDLELEPHEKELYNRHTEFLLRKWMTPTKLTTSKNPFERSKSEPKETSKEDRDVGLKEPLSFHRTKSTDEAEAEAVPRAVRPSPPSVQTPMAPPQISLPVEEASSRLGDEPYRQDEQGQGASTAQSQVQGRRWLERPKLICQSSDERDDEPSVPRPCGPCGRFAGGMLGRSDSLSEGESDQGDPSRRPSTPSRASPSLYSHLDLSDSEGRHSRQGGQSPAGGGPHGGHAPRRYSKRPLRGPYGQMLEAEMKKPEANRKLSQYTEDLKFLEEYPSKAQSLAPAAIERSSELTRSVSSGSEQRQNAQHAQHAARSRHQGAGAHSMDDTKMRAASAGATAIASTSPTAGTETTVPGGPTGAPKRKVSAELPFSLLHPCGTHGALGGGPGGAQGGVAICHQRTTSSPSQLEGIAGAAMRAEHAGLDAYRRAEERPDRAERTERAAQTEPAKITWKDTRTHVVVELYETERSYVESLEFLVKEYMQPLKKPENAGMVDAELVELIFYQVPAILSHHRDFLDDLQKRLENWDFQQKVGDVLLSAFTKRSVIETYTAFINNWKTAKEAIKSTCQAKPAFARYLEAMAREHKGKLALDSLLIMPVQRIPRYELLIQTLLKHTDPSHADHALLLDAQREVHELAVKINCTERESLEAEQQQQVLRDLEALVEGCELVSQGRVFLRHDLVTLASGQNTRKERVLFLFSDLVVVARIKRNLRKPSAAGTSTSVASGLEGNRYRCSMKAALDDLEIVKAKDESLRRVMREMEQLSEDAAALTQITELAAGLHLPHLPHTQLQQQQLEELARDLLSSTCRQLAERQNSDSQLSCLDLTVNTSNGVENITVIFTKPDKRSTWEESFNEAKTRLALSADRRPSPEFKMSVPIRKTRAGLQFTCAAPTLAGPGCAGTSAALGVSSTASSTHTTSGPRDVWVCNSDGYVGQVCVLSLQPEPNVTSCNGVCNARILCVAAIPAVAAAPAVPAGTGVGSTSCSAAASPRQFTNSKASISISVEDTDRTGRNLHLDSSSSSSDEDDDNDSGSTAEENQRVGATTADAQLQPPAVKAVTAAAVSLTSGSDGIATGTADTSRTTCLGSGQAAGAGTQGQGASSVPAPGTDSTGTGPTGVAPQAQGPQIGPGAGDDGLAQPTMWLGTEDGCIHVYSCNDNIRIKRNKVKIQHGAAVHCIMYFHNRVYVSLANGDVTVYSRDQVGGWNTAEPFTVLVGSAACPVTRMVPISGRLWCSCQHTIKILNVNTLQVEQTVVAADSNRSVTCFVVSGLAVWLSVQNSAVLKLYHASTFEHLGDVNVAPAVTKMLQSCDDIIRQHKAACLRVTSLLACKDLLWIGTSAGVILTMPLPHVAQGTTRLMSTPSVSGVPFGHTGHVRFLTVVEADSDSVGDSSLTAANISHHNRQSWKFKSDQTGALNTNKLLVISGGDGYEDFRTNIVSEVAGKEDSTNHLLMWLV